MNPELQKKCIDTIRFLAVDAVEKANSGHPGMPMGAAPMAFVLWSRHLRFNPHEPRWANRDRFVLSAGHGSMLLYAMLHLAGFDVTLDDLKAFRQYGSKTPGHPEFHDTPGVEATTGPLGQGISNAVGMALSQRMLAARMNSGGTFPIDHFVYGICSDGDLMEGVASEACSIAGHLKLGNLIFLYDDNHVSLAGPTDVTFTEDRGKRFEAYGWHVQHVDDGNDVEAIDRAIQAAKDDPRPSLIDVRTVIGYGSPNKKDSAEAHGSPLGEEEVKLTKQNLGWPWQEPFYVPDEVLQHCRQAVLRGEQAQKEWQQRLNAYKKAFPDAAAEFKLFLSGGLPEGWDDDLPVFKPEKGAVATRISSQEVVQALAKKIPNFVSGAADLYPSTNVYIKEGGDLDGDNFAARNIHYGIREHAMGSILQGIALHKGMIAFGSTFLIFYDYMRPPLRLAALMKNPLLMVFTHDSLGLGEDGPTHQPV